ncbi:hypothetical protein EVAR_61399_1 [Eumeta japonica]|uniref:Uncharacterized protein n=1 Tax=Eumeta variegata TaxID=151549 RepID=A0A4C1ZAP2_EUMVA|nr:hypothetical protein EVAR_61399_1 [Eumeta japonica]
MGLNNWKVSTCCQITIGPGVGIGQITGNEYGMCFIVSPDPIVASLPLQRATGAGAAPYANLGIPAKHNAGVDNGVVCVINYERLRELRGTGRGLESRSWVYDLKYLKFPTPTLKKLRAFETSHYCIDSGLMV